MSPHVFGHPRAALIAVALGVGTCAVAATPSESELAPNGVLEKQALVRAVLERNPSVAAAREAVQAARSRIPQVTALDDPMLSYSLAPLSIFDEDSRFGQQIKIEQRLPFPGKLSLSGEQADAESKAMEADVDQVRLELGLAATQLFDGWYTVHRAIAINTEHQALLKELKRSAEAQYTAGRASQQDPLQAEVVLTHLEHEGVVLQTRRDVIRTQLNALLHRPVTAELPPPPETIATAGEAPSSSEPLIDQAVRARPELAALRARLGGADAAVSLAQRQFWPDLSVMGEYNSMWPMTPHQWMVGVGVNLPIQLGRRRAAEDEARANQAQLRHREERLLDQVREDVETARVRLVEALHVVHLYETRLIPAAQDQVKAARAGFIVGQNPFNALVEAEKNLRSVQLAGAEASAEADLRQAELDRAIGVVPGASHHNDSNKESSHD